MTGFIAMERDALNHPLLKDADRFRAWFWLIANAAWRPTRTRIKGSMVDIDRGELTFSVRFLAENWGWSKSRVDRFLADLRAEGMIETRTKIGTSAGHSAGQGQSIITICNYSKYQSADDRQRDNAEPRNGTTAGQQRDKEEQGNKIKGGEGNAGASNAKSKPAKPKRVPADEVSMPDDWQPVLTPAAQRVVDGWPPGMLDRELMAFDGHARSNDRTTKDWQAAFRTWIAKAEERRTTPNASNRNSAGSPQARRNNVEQFTPAQRRLAELRAAQSGRGPSDPDEHDVSPSGSYGELPLARARAVSRG